MMCPVCNAAISDKDLVCRNCVGQKDYIGALEAFAYQIPNIVAGRLLLKLGRPAHTSKHHIRIFNHPYRALCGQRVGRVKDELELSLVQAEQLGTCLECRYVWARLLREHIARMEPAKGAEHAEAR